MNIDWHPDSTEAYDLWTQKFDQLLSGCFTKRTVCTGGSKPQTQKANRRVRSILADEGKKGKVQREIAKEFLKRVIELEARREAQDRASKLRSTMATLTEQEKFSPNGYWKMKRAADKNLKDEAASELMMENGVEVSGKEAVLEAYREEFKHRLRTREPHDGWLQHVEEVNRVIRNWLEGRSASSPPFDDSEIDAVISKLKKGKCPGVDDHPPDLFIHSGKGVRTSLRQLFNQIKESREIPDQWNYMKIVTIYKQKGSKKMLKYYRGIFLAMVVSKIFESLIKARIEPNLEKVNILQAGSRPKRGPADNVFLLRGCVDHHVANKKPLFITAYDYEQAFDSLWVEKCIMSLRNLGRVKRCSNLYTISTKKLMLLCKPHMA